MKLTYPTTLVLHALANGSRYGFDILDVTGLPSGTVYPILRRLAHESLVSGDWEDPLVAREEQRPPRRYYELTAAGRDLVKVARARYGVPRAASVRRLRPARSS